MRNGPIGRLRSRKGSRNREEYSRENWVVTQFQFANACGRTFPSSQRRGGRDINKMLRSILIYGADGVVRPAKVNIAPNSPLLRLRATALALRARLRGQKVASRLLD